MRLDRTRRERSRHERDAVTFGALRFTKQGLKTTPWRDLHRLALALSWGQFFAGLFAAEIAVNLFFATLYALQPGCIASARPGFFSDLFFFSVETMATVGYGEFTPATFYGHAVSSLEIMTGLTFTAVVTGLIFIRFSKPKPKVIFSDFAVIGDIDGQETLTIRIANGHWTALSDARATLMLLLLDRDSRGAVLRRILDVKLERTVLPFFPLTWNLIHRVTADSPFADMTQVSLRTADAKLILSIHAHDPAIASDIRAVHTYSAGTILPDHRFQDAVTIDETGHTTADLTRLSLVEPIAQAGPA